MRFMKYRICFAVLIALSAVSTAHSRVIVVEPTSNAQEQLQLALLDAKRGDVVELAAGRYVLTDGLSLDADGVTIQGAGPDKTILDFKNQKGAGEGLLVTSDDVVLKGFAVEDSKGDGIKSKGANRIVYTDLRVEWTGGPKTTNGAYGVYPVESTHILIDRVVVRGASDAGIYVGQSDQIVVRKSVAMYNVAGIEIENSTHADVHSNVAMHNTGGILVFDLPNLPKMGGHSVRIFSNRVTKNDTANFAPKGNIVASVPVGTGVMVMANRDVAVFGNALGENQTANLLIIAYPQSFNDKSYNPYPRNVSSFDNQHGRAGWDPALVPDAGARTQLGSMQMAVYWDGLRAEGSQFDIRDVDQVFSLGQTKLAAGPEGSSPSPVRLVEAKPIPLPKPVVLPAAMEAATQ